MKEMQKKKDFSSILLITFVIITSMSFVVSSLIRSATENWYEKRNVIIIIMCLQIAREMSFILPALAIKNRTYRVIAIVLAIVMIVFLSYSPILTLFDGNIF